MAAYFEIGEGVLPKIKFNLAFMVVLVTCKNEEDHSTVKGWFCLKIKLIQAFMHDLVT